VEGDGKGRKRKGSKKTRKKREREGGKKRKKRGKRGRGKTGVTILQGERDKEIKGKFGNILLRPTREWKITEEGRSKNDGERSFVQHESLSKQGRKKKAEQ